MIHWLKFTCLTVQTIIHPEYIHVVCNHKHIQIVLCIVYLQTYINYLKLLNAGIQSLNWSQDTKAMASDDAPLVYSLNRSFKKCIHVYDRVTVT